MNTLFEDKKHFSTQVGAKRKVFRSVWSIKPEIDFSSGQNLAAKTIAWAGIGLLDLRAVAGFIQVLYFVVSGKLRLWNLGVWEPWFWLGAALFAVDFCWYMRGNRHQQSETGSGTVSVKRKTTP